MSELLAPAARSQFAKRLKAIRTRRGFERARYFAQSLGIEENRYTRYERAEVEPNLTLIYKMCETLRVTPNELLGFSESEIAADVDMDPLANFSESGQPRYGRIVPPAAETRDALAWRLAAEVVSLHREAGAKGKPAVADPLKRMQDTGSLFRSLQSEPFGTVAQILADPALDVVDAARKAELADLIETFTASAG